MRLKDRTAIVIGAGQSPGEGIGNGRATAMTFAREGARVLMDSRYPGRNSLPRLRRSDKSRGTLGVFRVQLHLRRILLHALRHM